MMQLIWDIPVAPNSEHQQLEIKDDLLNYLESPKHELMNVQMTMLLAMAHSISLESFMDLDINMKSKLLTKFCDFFSKQVNDYRLR